MEVINLVWILKSADTSCAHVNYRCFALVKDNHEKNFNR